MGKVTRRARSFAGGTIIAEVDGLEEHRRRIETPSAYRPAACRACGGDVLHVHDYRERKLRFPNGTMERVRLLRFVCTSCGGIWRVMPRFICLGLWRTWQTVDRAVASPDAETGFPKRTVQRWRRRLADSARLLVVVIASALGPPELTRIATATGLDGTQRDLVANFAAATGRSTAVGLALLSAIVHAVRPGTRLMSPAAPPSPPLKVSVTPPEMPAEKSWPQLAAFRFRRNG